VPIYYGAPNIADVAVAKGSYIDYRDFGSPQKLYAELERLNADDEAYEAMLAWKKWPITDLNPTFVGLMKYNLDHHTQCKVCREVVEQRLDPGRQLLGTNCLRNKTWLAKFPPPPGAPAAAAPAPAALPTV
jgi:hypothetical protein